MITQNLCLKTDSYKISHWLQFPEGATESSYYIESRGSKIEGVNHVMSMGSEIMADMLEKGVTKEDVEYARDFYKQHFMGQEIFNYEGFMRIVNEFNGKLPLRIRAVPDGTVIPVKNVQATYEATHPDFEWLAGFFETKALRTTWYTSTVATISFETKKVIKEALDKSSDLSGEDYASCLSTRLHDFGARGVSSGESAAHGGFSHIVNYGGSDTVEAIEFARHITRDNTLMAAFSIPAREHSTTTCYLREGEYEAFMNSVRNFGGGFFAVVIDSYSTKNALKWLTTNKEFIRILTEKGGTCVLRPDSGLPVDMVTMCLNFVAENVGFTRNSKGYKVLDPRFRVIQGDGVDLEEIRRICGWCVNHHKFSMENFLFGMGGGLLQHCDRDWFKYAMKCSAMKVDGEWRDVYKAPETDPSKKSKAGRLDLIINSEGEYETVRLEDSQISHPRSVMVTVFEDGERKVVSSMQEIRERSELNL